MSVSLFRRLENIATVHNRVWLAFGPLEVWFCLFSLSLFAHSNRFSLILALLALLNGIIATLFAQRQWQIRAFADVGIHPFVEACMVGFSFLLAALLGAPFVWGSDFLFYIVALLALGSFAMMILLARNVWRHPNLQ